MTTPPHHVLDVTQLPPFPLPATSTPPALAFAVNTRPAPKGSKKLAGRRLVEVSPHVKAFTTATQAACKAAIAHWERTHGATWTPIAGPVAIATTITMPTSKAAEKAGRTWHTGTPDTDKLQRAIGDAISPTPVPPDVGKGLPEPHRKTVRDAAATTARRWAALHDDSRISVWLAAKAYPATLPTTLAGPGVLVAIWPLSEGNSWT